MAKPGATRRASFPGTSTTNCKIHNRLKTKVERRYRIYHPPLNRERNYIRIGTFHHDLKPVPLFTIATRKAFTNRPLSSLSSRSLLFSRILDRLPFRANRPLINQLINSGTSGYKYNLSPSIIEKSIFTRRLSTSRYQISRFIFHRKDGWTNHKQRVCTNKVTRNNGLPRIKRY